jgi:hypothetical protein
VKALRWTIATSLLGVGLWRLMIAVDQARLWWHERLVDPSAADLYLTNAEVDVGGGVIALVVAALLLWSGWIGGSSDDLPGVRARRLVLTLGAAILLALALRFGGQALGRSRCDHAGGRWDAGLRICVAAERGVS